MVNAVVLINAERGAINDVAQHILSIDGVREVYSVAGRYDLVAVLWAQSNEQVADIVTQAVHQQPGIQATETLLAFKTYSKEDLENAFGIGLDTDTP
jgi:DNA-binding Lrp family transcriptional regulator